MTGDALVERGDGLTGPQKAAMMLVQLGKERSAKVLRTMADDEVEALMIEVTLLEGVHHDTMDDVLAEFVEAAATRLALGTGGGQNYARLLLEEGIGADRAAVMLDRIAGGGSGGSRSGKHFGFVTRADPHQLLTLLQDEHPQVIALVLAHIDPEKAASLIARLPGGLQAVVAHRIAVMDRTSQDVIRNVEQALERKLAAHTVGSAASSASGGLQPLVDILTRSDPATEALILEGLAAVDPELADEIRRKMFIFADIVTLDDRAVQLLLREVDTKDLALALKGVAEEVGKKVFKNMSERAAANLAEEVELLGPQRASSVQEAQETVVKVIRSLEEAGQIVLARGGDDFIQ